MFKMHQGVFRYILSILVLLLFAMKTLAQEVSEPLDSIIKTLKLKEVVVKAKKIRQSGDTISYASSSYISKDDKVLEDLLRKMPGVEVIGNGQIKYNGQWVNEFYIEGADMLGDNYGEATKNLDAKAIGSVQIMENHQNIKLFQGTKSGNAPAMNIKLKQTAKGAWTAMLSVAVGGQPKLARNMTLNLMNFRRNSQNLTLLKTNNVGDDLRKEINASSSLNSVLGAGILLPDKPAVSDLYAYRNDSYSASINQLYKLDKDRTLSFNVNYLYDQEKQNATDESRYLLDDGTRYVIQESNQALVGQHFVGGHVAYKLNSSKSYLKNNLSVNASFPKNEGLVNDFVSQTLSGHSFLLSNVMKANYKKKNGGVADLEWKASFADKRGMLNMSETKMSQLLRQRNFQSEATGSLLAFTIPHLMFNLNGKVMFDWQRVSAGLNSLSDASGSEQKTWLLGAFVSPKILLHFGNRLQWLVYVPVGVKYYHSADGSLDYDKRFFSTCLYSNLTYKPTGRLSFDLTTICEESMPSVLSQMVLKHYVNYRTTMSNPYQVEITPNRSVKLAFTSSYKDIIKMLFGGVTLSYVDVRNGNSMGYQVITGQDNPVRNTNKNHIKYFKMKNYRKLLVMGMMLVGMNVSAQVSVTYALDSPTFTLAHESTDKFETLDSAYLSVTYRFKYRQTAKDDSLRMEDLMDLQLGRKYNAFFSKNLRDLDQENTKSLKTTMRFTPIPEEYVGFDILFSHSDKTCQVTNRIPYTSQVIEYSEKKPDIKWRYLPEDTATVMGYLCHAAECQYGGRTWKVYYADKIALPYGPWMLNGAKGLILKAVDSDHDFVFEAVGLTQKSQPVIRYTWSRKTMSKDEWQKYAANMYKNAGAFVRNTGARIIVMDNSEKGFHHLNEDWEQYYNPLEK